MHAEIISRNEERSDFAVAFVPLASRRLLRANKRAKLEMMDGANTLNKALSLYSVVRP
jgi:hypothetical protein